MPRLSRHVPAWFCLLAILALLVAGCESKAPPAESGDDVAATDSDPADASPGTDDATDSDKEAPGPPGDDGPAERDASKMIANENDAPPLPTPADEPQDDPVADATPVKVTPGTDPLVPRDANRPTTEGWWRIVFFFNGNDISAGFVNIAKDTADKFTVQEIRTNDVINPAKLVRSEVTDKSVKLFFEQNAENKFDYQGTLQDNVVRGNLQFKNDRQDLIRLVPVDESQATDAELDKQNLGPTFGLQEIVTALQSDPLVDSIGETAKTWKNSPALYLAYRSIFAQAEPMELDRAALDKLANDFAATGRIWGERAEQAARLHMAYGLLTASYETDLGKAQLEQVEKQNPDLVAKWDSRLSAARRASAIDEAHRKIVDGKTDEGLKELQALTAEKPSDPVASYRLAAAEQQHGSKEEAFRLFSRLAVQPQAERELGDIAGEVEYVAARTAAAKLYEAEHGNRDGFDAHLAGVYHEVLKDVVPADAAKQEATDSERTTLVELFTGAMCPPCVAADVATEAVTQTFPATDVVVLRYHMNIPGPDPLSNTDSETRSEYYGEEFLGTPSVFVDGTVASGVAGPFSMSADAYEALSSVVTSRVAEPAKAKIDLTASVEGNTLKIEAKASDVVEIADSMRLRIAIAESQIDFVATNGIRVHEMVVREMPGGASGVAPVDGAFSFQQEVPLVETRDRLVSFLDDLESKMSLEMGQPFAFDERPMDLRRLTVIAFLQDDATHEVLQTAVAPIEQDVELPALAARSSANPFESVTEEPDEPKESNDGPAFADPGE